MRLGRRFWVLVLIGVFGEVVAQARTVSWLDLPSQTRKGWQRLLHTRVDPTSDPALEWDVLQGLAQLDPQVNGMARRHYGCRFPARWRYYFYKTNQTYQKLRCEDLQEWQDQLSIQSLSFVYASTYLGNPASMFGHNFIRLNLLNGPGSIQHQQESLLDYGIAFMAATDPNDWLSYVYKGLTGGYPGGYIMQPYYELLNQYAYGEGRNLWEIEIHLTPFERIMARDHVWELLHEGSTPYYFTHVNCSSMLLEFLDAIKPDWSLRAQITGIVAPPQAYKVVYQAVEHQGRLSHGSREFYWPSSRTLFFDQISSLSDRERRHLEAIMHRAYDGTISDLTNDVRLLERASLEAALSWVQLRKAALVFEEQNHLRTFEKTLMVARLGLPQAPRDPTPVSTGESPGQSHDPGMIGVGMGLSQAGPTLEVRGRLGHHDRFDPRAGYDPYSEVQYGSFQLSLPPMESRSLSSSHRRQQQASWNLSLAEIKSLAPYSAFEKNISWTVLAGAGRESLSRENYVYGKGAAGWSFEVMWFENGQTLWSVLPGLTVVQEVSGPHSLGLGWTPGVSVLQHFKDDFVVWGGLHYDSRLLGAWAPPSERGRGPLQGELTIRKNLGKVALIDMEATTGFQGKYNLKAVWSHRF